MRWRMQRKYASRIDGLKAEISWPIPDGVEEVDRITRDDEKVPLILTHDVDTEFGFNRIWDVCEVEKRMNLKSSWYIVPDLYDIEIKTLDYLREAGMEVGVHDWNHDGKLFSTRATFERRLPLINKKIEEWSAKGFRAGMAFHNDDWMSEFASEYDTSYYDSDPFQPMGGGCRKITPFMLGGIVELPYTMAQDHVLFVQSAAVRLRIKESSDDEGGRSPKDRKIWEWMMDYCGQKMGDPVGDRIAGYYYEISGVEIWKMKAHWLIDNGGLVLMITHPDYLCHPRLTSNRARETWFGEEDVDLIRVRDEGIIGSDFYGSILEQYAAFLTWFSREFEGLYRNELARNIAEFYREKGA